MLVSGQHAYVLLAGSGTVYTVVKTYERDGFRSNADEIKLYIQELVRIGDGIRYSICVPHLHQ